MNFSLDEQVWSWADLAAACEAGHVTHRGTARSTAWLSPILAAITGSREHMRSVIVSARDMLYSRGMRERLLDDRSPAPYALTATDIGRIWAHGVSSMLPEMPLSVCDLTHEPWRAQHAEAERDAMRAWCHAIPGMGFDAHESAADWWRCLGSAPPPKARTRFGKDGQPITLRVISDAHDLALAEWQAVSDQLLLQDADRLDAGKRAFVRALLRVCQTRRDHLALMLLQPPYVPPAPDSRETDGEREQRLHRAP